MPPKEKTRPVTVALITTGGVILVALLGFLGTRTHADSPPKPTTVGTGISPTQAGESSTDGKQVAPSPTGSPQEDSSLVNYTGTVRDGRTNRPIGGAKVAITEDEDVPQRLTTDSEGVFYAKLHKTSKTILLTIGAVGYKEYTRRAKSVRTGGEDILLEPEQSQSSPPAGGNKSQETTDIVSVPFEASYPPVGGQIQHCPCIAYAVEEKGLTITNNCPGPVPIMCVKDTEFIPPGPANIDMLQLAPGRRFAHTMIAAGKKAFFDASGKIGDKGACQYYACPGTDLQPQPLRCQVGPILPPPSAACIWPPNTGVVGQPCNCPNGATGILTQ
jgi:hypothetical protein